MNLGPSKAQILAKIAEISSWGKCTEAGAMNGRKCRLVQSDVLERYNLHELSAINTWEFATETKKRGRKADDSRTEEDTPPAKTPRVSLIKQFIQPAASSSASKVSSSQENELPEGEN
jgi:chromatin assembly factor 1 subunit A